MKLLRKEGIQVFIIGLTDELDDEGGFIRVSPKAKAIDLLGSIASESGGRAFFPKLKRNNVEELNEAVEDIAVNLHRPYERAEAPADGKFHKIDVKIADAPGGKKRRTFARPGYFAPGGEAQQKNKTK